MFPDRTPRKFLDTRVLSRLAGIPLFARKAMQGALSGRHASPHRGSSVAFARYRPSVPGDARRARTRGAPARHHAHPAGA